MNGKLAVAAQDKQKEIDFFDSHASENAYDVFTPETNARLIETCARAACFRRGGLIADLGCGSGVFTDQLHRLGYEAVGLDISSKLVALGKNRYSGMQFLQGDVEFLPFSSGSLDGVLLSGLLHHLPDPSRCAAEVFRVLKPGGTAFVTTENLCSLLNCCALILGYTPFSLMQVCGRYCGNPLGLHSGEPLVEHLPIDHPAFAGVAGHIRILTVRQAKEIFEMAGFEVEAHSVSILPLPDGLSQFLEKFIRQRGHYLNLKAKKPAQIKPI